MRQSRGAAGWWLVAATLVLMVAVEAGAEGFSGLVGQELKIKPDLGSRILGAISSDAGKITKVVVTADEPLRLVVQVFYEGFAGRKLNGTVLLSEGQPQPFVPLQAADLTAGGSPATLTFEVAPNCPAGAKSNSSLLKLRVGRPGRPIPDLERTYFLTKNWEKAVAGDQQLIRVTPMPIGEAARLKEPWKLIPPATVKPPLKTLPRLQVSTLPSPLKPTPLMSLKPGAGPGPSSQPTPGGAATTATSTATSSAPSSAAAALPSAALRTITPVERFHFGLEPAVTDRGGKGPGTDQIDLLTAINSQVLSSFSDICTISPRVFVDQNPASGVYYYLPEAYRLVWDPVEGYGMRMLYMAAATEGAAGKVQAAVSLDTGVRKADTDLVQELLTVYAQQHGLPFTKLARLQITQPPAVSLCDDLRSLYDIPAESVVVPALSDQLERMQVQWAMDTVTKDNMQLALMQDVGVNGTVTLIPGGGVLSAQPVRVRIALAERDTLGRFPWQRGQNWRNTTPFPVRLKYLHVLLMESEAAGAPKTPWVYSWDLGGTLVLPQAQVEFDPSKIPAWLDARARRMWLDYSIPADRDREQYDRKVMDAIAGSVVSLTSQNAVIKALTPLEDTGAAELTVKVRSKYFDPRDRTLRYKPGIPVTEDGAEYTFGPVYLVNRQPGEVVEGDPLFEYTITVVMPDGTTHEPKTWLAAHDLRVFVGTAQIQQAVGAIPGVTAPEEGTQPDTTAPVPPAGGSDITLRILTPLADLGAKELTVHLRSRRFTAQPGEVQEKTSDKVTQDSVEFKMGPLFPGDREPGVEVEGDPLFEFTVDLVLQDGTAKAGTVWLPANDLRVLIGALQARQAVGMAADGEG